MKTLITISSAVVLLASFTGCRENVAWKCASPDDPACFEEIASPLGCNKDANRYFDFTTQTCVKPIHYETLYTLGKYREINEIAAERNDDIIVQVIFKDWLDESSLQAVLDDEDVISVEQINLYYPNIWNGLTAPVFIPEDVPKHNSVSWAANHTNNLMNGSFAEDQSFAEGFVVSSTRLTLNAKNTVQFWARHLQTIRVIQPIITELDSIQATWTPDEQIGGTNQIIDWESGE